MLTLYQIQLIFTSKFYVYSQYSQLLFVVYFILNFSAEDARSILAIPIIDGWCCYLLLLFPKTTNNLGLLNTHTG